jgi:hypothetical protein
VTLALRIREHPKLSASSNRIPILTARDGGRVYKEFHWARLIADRCRIQELSKDSRVKNRPLTWYNGAEGGIRTPDPRLGKVVVFARLGPPGLLKRGPVHPVSSPSTTSAPVVRRSTIRANERRRYIELPCWWGFTTSVREE